MTGWTPPKNAVPESQDPKLANNVAPKPANTALGASNAIPGSNNVTSASNNSIAKPSGVAGPNNTASGPNKAPSESNNVVPGTNNIASTSSNIMASPRQPMDFFAEQNQKRAEKKEKFKKIRKWLILAGVVVGLAVAGISVFLIIKHAKDSDGPVVDGGGSESDGDTAMAGVDDLNEKITEVFKPTYSVNEAGEVVVDGDLEAVERSYEAALANPVNKKRIDTIYLAQIVFYASLSDNERIVQIAEKVDPERLNVSEKIKFYNLTYLAYAALGNKEQADRYYILTREAADKVNGIGG